ncbi:site-specific integrase [Rhodococcus sp. 05-2255-1e]|nr:site-specific integrase [Rhodococcus sp. 05-2255-1e]
MTQADSDVGSCGAYVVQAGDPVTAKKPARRGFGRLRQFRSGRWKASYTGPDGMLYEAPETFAAKIDAEAWLTDRRREIDRDLWSPKSGQNDIPDAPFGEYAEGWMAQHSIKDRTREHYRKLLDNHILPTFAPVALSSIDPAAVRRWYATTAVGTPTMRAHAYSLLRTILETAVRDDVIESNPCRISGAGTAKRAVKIRPATLDELSVIVEEMPERLRVMVLLASWCAMRYGELSELRRKDVEVIHGVIRVRRGVVRVGGGFKVTTPKTTAGVRDISVPPHLLPAIEDHLRAHTAPGRDALLFPSAGDADRHLAPAALYRPYYKAREAAGRDDLRWHDLRHTGAVLAASTGATLAELMARLGHSSPQAAMRYQHASRGRDAQIASALSKLVETEHGS